MYLPTKLLYDMSKAKVTGFAIHHPYYKDKLISNLTQTLIYFTNYLYLLCSLSNFIITSSFTYNVNTYTSQLKKVNKKEKSPKTFSIFITNTIMLFYSRFSPLYLFYYF